jgi:hypothetical protein
MFISIYQTTRRHIPEDLHKQRQIGLSYAPSARISVKSTLIVPHIYVSIQATECIEIELSADYCHWKGGAVWD